MKSLGDRGKLPILMFGDLNEITCSREEEGGSVRAKKQMDAFRDVIDYCGLRELGFRGGIFTWKRGKSAFTLKREWLDQMLAYERWCSMFAFRDVFHHTIYLSDHVPISLKVDFRAVRGGGDRLYHFKAMCVVVKGGLWAGGG